MYSNYLRFRNSEKVPSVKLVDGDEHLRLSIVKQLLNVRTVISSALQGNPNEVDVESKNGDYSGSGDSGSGSGDEIGSGKPTENWTTEPTTDKIPTVIVATDTPVTPTKDLSSTDVTDEVESSGSTPYYKYTTTSKTDIILALTDDEDLIDHSGGSGYVETTTDPIPTTDGDISFISTTNTYTNIFLKTDPLGGTAAANTVSYVILLFVILLVVVYM